MMRIDFTENFTFFFASYFFRFVGILIYCRVFAIDGYQVKANKTLSQWMRNITVYKLGLLGLSNMGYIVISLIIFVLF